MSDNRISIFVEGQLPAHIRNNYETFTKFLIYYYEYMEQAGNPIDRSFDYLKHTGVQDATGEYLEKVASKFVSNIPLEGIEEKKILIQNVAKFYNSKGTEKSYNFIFNILFGEDVDEFFLPKRSVMYLSVDARLSSEKKLFDGVYYQNHSYVLKVSTALFDKILENKEYILKLVHPIGKQIFLENIDTQEVKAL